jgi:hypothetical protein
MGCDIHMYVEYKKDLPIKNSKERESKWISGDYFKMNPFNEIWDDETKLERMELYGGRNYALFSTLAGVRDYTNSIVPVSKPKGIPDDCCLYVKSEYKDWGYDGHTPSWLTLKELKDYQETQPTLPRTGLLSPTNVIEFDKNGIHPQYWCQGTNQEGYERRNWIEENKTLIPLIEALQRRSKELMHYDWEEYDIKNDENVRIVFWFDN